MLSVKQLMFLGAILCYGLETKAFSFKTAGANGTSGTAPGRPMEAPRNKSAAKGESAKLVESPEQLKIGRSHGKMLVKSGLMKFQEKMVEQSLERGREACQG